MNSQFWQLSVNLKPHHIQRILEYETNWFWQQKSLREVYDIFTHPVVGYLRPGFFCVNFMVPGPMTGFIDLGDAVGGNWAENELFQQIKTSQSLTNKSVERGGKHHLVEESPRINTIFSETTHFLGGSWNHGTDWYHFWNGIIDGFDLLKAQQIAVPGPLDGHKPPLPICWGAEKAKREVERLRVKPNSWMIESTKSMVGNLWLENFQIPKILIVWVKWQLTH